MFLLCGGLELTNGNVKVVAVKNRALFLGDYNLKLNFFIPTFKFTKQQSESKDDINFFVNF